MWIRASSWLFGGGKYVVSSGIDILLKIIATRRREGGRGRGREETHSVITSYPLNASSTALTSSKATAPSRPVYVLRSLSRAATASCHFSRKTGSSHARKPTHHPSKMTTFTWGSPSPLTVVHRSSGTRSPCPAKADLSYCGMAVGAPARREAKTERASGRSWVPGWPLCWRSGLEGFSCARRCWAAWGR